MLGNKPCILLGRWDAMDETKLRQHQDILGSCAGLSYIMLVCWSVKFHHSSYVCLVFIQGRFNTDMMTLGVVKNDELRLLEIGDPTSQTNMLFDTLWLVISIGFKHFCYFPFHKWDNPNLIDELHHFSRWWLHHQPDILTFNMNIGQSSKRYMGSPKQTGLMCTSPTYTQRWT